MPRDKEQIARRNAAIRQRYKELREGKCRHWRSEPVYELLAQEFFLSVRRVVVILTESHASTPLSTREPRTRSQD
jgi:hypothetical protein